MADFWCPKNLGDYVVDIDVDRVLGAGSYGKVYRSYHVRTKRHAAAKMFQWEKKYVSKETDQEAETMMRMPEHENVIRILDYIKRDIKEKKVIQIWLIMELCPLGTLASFSESTLLTTIEKINLMLQSARGVRHLHHLKPNPIIHRDIKLTNILVSGSEESPIIKIADFGEARFIDRMQLGASLALHSIRGTQRYWAPEMFSISVHEKEPSYGKSVDVYSLGVSSLALLEKQEGSPIRVRTGEMLDTFHVFLIMLKKTVSSGCALKVELLLRCGICNVLTQFQRDEEKKIQYFAKTENMSLHRVSQH